MLGMYILCKQCSTTLDESLFRVWRTVLKLDSLPNLWLARLQNHSAVVDIFPHTTH